MKRHLCSAIKEDLQEKIVILSGPRQVGKTTLSRELYQKHAYLNFDNKDHRLSLINRDWKREGVELVVFDEIHKMPKWKSWLKGIYDVEGVRPRIIVTGSARLDTFKKAGDSLAGRFFSYRLLPLTLKELKQLGEDSTTIKQLTTISGFPEPYLKGSERFYKRWRRSHLDIILRQDLVDLENVRDLSKIETLIELLRTRVGSTVSYSSLATDLECSHETVKKWLQHLENLFIIFTVSPWHKNIARSLLKESKYYFYDTAAVLGDDGARLENFVALSLLRELYLLEDLEGEECSLHFLRTKDGAEIDFGIAINKKIKWLIEVKLQDSNPSPAFKFFLKYFERDKPQTVQLVGILNAERDLPEGLKIRAATSWLRDIELKPALDAGGG